MPDAVAQTRLALTRRRLLQLGAAGGAAVALPWVSGCGDAATEVLRFFDAAQRRVVEALAEAIAPEDETVGALGCDAVEFVDRALAVLEAERPLVYGRGPFSGREPYPDPSTGDPTGDFPPDLFSEPLPLTRLQELSFRIELYGSASVPNGEINAPIVPPTPGLRALYAEAIARLQAFAAEEGAPDFAALAPERRLAGFQTTAPDFQQALLGQLAEGMFSAPEYGGNRDALAWRQYEYDGDSQPLGHTLFDRTTQTLRDRPDEPSEAADPRRPPRPFPPAVESFLTAITLAQGGKKFF